MTEIKPEGANGSYHGDHENLCSILPMTEYGGKTVSVIVYTGKNHNTAE